VEISRDTDVVGYRQSMHRASPYTEIMGPRDVRRSTVIDDGPFALGISKIEIENLK
jgi:alpha-ketoglutarate-dependent 2,4-dichlorophenoxyacetate dioxygenase